jgi:hypothetical protein
MTNETKVLWIDVSKIVMGGVGERFVEKEQSGGRGREREL